MPVPRLFLQTKLGVNIAELANAEVESVSWALNGIGDVKFDMSADDPQIAAPLLHETEVKVVIEGTNERWVGPLMTAKDTAEKSSFVALSLEHYFTERFVDDASMLYTSIDQNSIAIALVNFAQSEATQANRDLNIDIASFALSGKLRSRDYQRENHEQIFDLLSGFPDLDGGFDWSVTQLPNGIRQFTCHNPKRGVFQSELAFEWDENGSRNIKDFDVDESAVQLDTHAYVTGNTSGGVKFEQNFEDVAKSAKYGLVQQVVSDGNQGDIAWLLDRAKSEVDLYGDPIVMPTLTAIEAPSTILGVLHVGDTFKVRIKRGRVNIAGTYRATKMEWKPKDGTILVTVN